MVKAYFRDLLRYLPLLFELTSKDIKLKYRRSVLGILWSILNPLLIMIVLTQVFTLLLRVQPVDMPFAVYYILGSTIFNFFVEATSSSMSSIINNSSLIKKVYIPKYIFPVQKCMFAFVNMIFSMIAVIIVMAYYILKGAIHLHATVFFFFIPMGFAFFFAVGLSLMLAAFTVYFRDLMHLWGVITTVWLYMTPIIYPLTILGNSKIIYIVKLNPLYYFVDSFRNIMVVGHFPSLTNYLASFISCIFVLILGTFVFKKTQDRFILHI